MTSVPMSTSDSQPNSNKSSECNMNTKKHHSRTRTRVVQSRFRAGLSGSKNDSLTKSGSSLNNKDGSVGDSQSFLNNGAKSKSLRGATSLKSAVGKSTSNINGATGVQGHNKMNITLNAKPTKSNTGAADKQSTARALVKTKPGQSGSTKLHSTVIAERTMIGSTLNLFSTTFVGGLEPGGKTLGVPKKADVTSFVLPELPDISAIRLDSISSDKGEDTTILSAASDKDLCNGHNDSLKEVTYDDLQTEYLRYLQAAYIDCMADDVFKKQIDELKTQVLFLEQLTGEKEQEISDCKKKVKLLQHHQMAHKSYIEQMEQLNRLVVGVPASEEALNVLSGELEKNLHQVKMDNLYVPENHKEYRDELSDALKSQTDVLQELQSLVEPRSHQLSVTASLLDDLQENSQRIQQYHREVNQASRLAIQEASLQISARLTESRKESLEV